MFDPTHAGAVQPALFDLTREPDPPDASGRWVYPCGLCGSVEVSDDGGLCTSCAPNPVSKPNRTRKTTKTSTARTPPKKPTGRSTKPTRTTARQAGGGR